MGALGRHHRRPGPDVRPRRCGGRRAADHLADGSRLDSTAASAFRVVRDHVTSVFRHDDLASALAATDLTEQDLALSLTHARHHPGRRIGHAAVPDHDGGQQAAAARLRQAADLLPALHADHGRHPRHPGDHHRRRRAELSPAARRRVGVRHQPHLRGPGSTRRSGPGLRHRRRPHRHRFSGIGVGRQHLLRPGSWHQPEPVPKRQRRSDFRLLGGQPVGLRRRRVQRRRHRAVDRGEAGHPEIALRGARACTSTTTTSSRSRGR